MSLLQGLMLGIAPATIYLAVHVARLVRDLYREEVQEWEKLN